MLCGSRFDFNLEAWLWQQLWGKLTGIDSSCCIRPASACFAPLQLHGDLRLQRFKPFGIYAEVGMHESSEILNLNGLAFTECLFGIKSQKTSKPKSDLPSL